MVAKAKAIPHGHADLAYIMGESKKKEHAKEKILFIASHGLDPLCRSKEAWEEMSLACRGHKRMTHSMIQIILSPDKNCTKDFTMADWERLWEEFTEAFDTLDHRNPMGKLISKPTNIRNSLHTVWLHFDSKSGTPHLHAAVCRVDMDGNTIPDGNIHLRAQGAAEVVNRRRGWKSPKEIRKEQIALIKAQCVAILKAMPRYSLSEFHSRLRSAGFEVLTNKDSSGKVRGHSIKRGNCHYKMSEIGRMFTVDRLQATWLKIHERDAYLKQGQTSKPMPAKPNVETTAPQLPDYTRPASDRVRCDFNQGEKSSSYYVPRQVLDFFNSEFDDWQISNADELRSIATAIFVGLLMPPDTPTTGGGGGSSNDKDWGRDPKEDEMEWARRCAMLARQHAKPIARKSRGR